MRTIAFVPREHGIMRYKNYSYTGKYHNERIRKVIDVFKMVTDKCVKNLDYSLNPNYRYGNFNGKEGVIEKIDGKEYWSYLNSLNTNYSSIDKIIAGINYYSREIIFDSECLHSDNIDNTVELYEEYMTKCGSELLLTDNDRCLRRELIITTQGTWNLSVVSTIKCFLGLNGYYNYKSDLNLNRGGNDDFKGIDYKIEIDDVEYSAQQKRTYIHDRGDHYEIPDIVYSSSYDNIDILTINCNKQDNVIYILKNPKKVVNGTVTVNKNDLIKKISMENKITETLSSIHQKTMMKKIRFVYETDEQNKDAGNYYKIITDDKVPTVILSLNDLKDVNLENMLKEIENKL